MEFFNVWYRRYSDILIKIYIYVIKDIEIIILVFLLEFSWVWLLFILLLYILSFIGGICIVVFEVGVILCFNIFVVVVLICWVFVGNRIFVMVKLGSKDIEVV